MQKKILVGLASAALVLGAGLTRDAQAFHIIPTQYFEDFNTNESLIGQGLWLERGSIASPDLLVVDGSLTYAAGGLPPAKGNSILLTGQTGKDARIPFDFDDPAVASALTPADGNTYYLSMIVMWDGTTAVDGESYISAFLATDSEGSTTGRGVLNIRGESGEVQLGVRLGTVSVTPPLFDISNPLVANEPVFAVVKVTEIPGARNDTAELFLFKNTAVPATEPATANVISENDPNFTGTSPDVQAGNGMRQITVRQFSGDYPGNILIDQIRVGTTWGSIITDPASVSDWTLF